MFYEFSIAVPANTAEASPHTQELQLTAGILVAGEVEFPSGCAGLVHLQVRQPEATWLPTNPDGNLASDNHVIQIRDYLELTPGRNTLKAVAWNTDETYAHTLRLRLIVLPREVVEPVSPLIDLMRKFLRMVGVR